jgi:hypothetical protein
LNAGILCNRRIIPDGVPLSLAPFMPDPDVGKLSSLVTAPEIFRID